MEVVKELHAAVANACEASFDSAYEQMKSHIDAHAKEAEIKESMAIQAQRQLETRIRDLQHDITVLRSELQQYEVDPQDLELPGKYANLETEFDPRNLWGKIWKAMIITMFGSLGKELRPNTPRFTQIYRRSSKLGVVSSPGCCSIKGSYGDGISN